MNVGDWVLVRRPKLPARIGRVVRLGRRHAYIGVGRPGPNYKIKRYAYASVEIFWRRVLIPAGTGK